MALTTKNAAALAGGGTKERIMAKEEVKNYEVLVGFCIGDGVNVWPGDVIEMNEADARRAGTDVQPTDKKVGSAPKQPHRKDPVRNQDPKGIRNTDPK